MGSASKYWQLAWLDGTGQQRVEEVAIAKAFFRLYLAIAKKTTLMLQALNCQDHRKWLKID